MSHRTPACWSLVLVLVLPACVTSTETLYDYDGDGSLDENDCDTTDPTIFPGALDTYGDQIDQDCDGGDGIDRDDDGYPANVPVDDPRLDCNDEEAQIHPSAEDTFGDGLDSNCDGYDGIDADGDGYPSIDSDGDDCDDSNDNVHPGASDNVGDDIDANCDGHDGTDNDGDGAASLNSEGTDCDDTQPLAFPGNPEICDGIDNDCAEGADDGFDGDGDGVTSCGVDGEPGTADDDCDDADPQVQPGLPEQCDLKDNDCDGQQPADEVDQDEDTDPACSDCDESQASVNSLDADGDGYSSCGADGIPDNGDEDCDDLDPVVNPGAEDPWGDTADQNCDVIDGIDLDGDGWAVNAVGPTRDCDDGDAGTYPGAPDVVSDGFDTNCDDIVGTDDDGDTYASDEFGGNDCDDSDPNAYPGAPDIVADGLDNNCDGIIGTDNDGDSYASVESGGDDCDDGDATEYPGAADPWGDGFDSDCDGVDGEDLDGDGWAGNADPGSPELDCDDSLATGAHYHPGGADNWGDHEDTNCDGTDGVDGDGDGWSINAGGTDQDCDDADPAIYPGAPDAVVDGIDSNCDGIPGVDDDGDGFASNGVGVLQDCDDSRSYIYPGAPDPAGNGLDEDCDNCNNVVAGLVPGDGIDTDCDGYALNGAGALQDCDDSDEDIFPGSIDGLWESPGLQIDVNCDGDFSTVVNRANVTFIGVAAGDESGYTVAPAGDVDGDGVDDFLIGAPKADSGGHPSSGAAYFVPGSLAQSLFNTALLLSPGITSLVPPPDGLFTGGSLTALGDLDQDGFGEIAIGAQDRVYVVRGASLLAAPNGVFSLANADVIIEGPANRLAGWSIAGGRDVDGDGLSDLLIGAPGLEGNPGRAYLVGGALLLQAALGDRTLSLALVGIEFFGQQVAGQGERSGYSVALVDTAALDGYADLLIGAPEAHPPGLGANTGRAYLVRGSLVAALPPGASRGLSSIGIVLDGEFSGARAGDSVANAGDVDGDGEEDLLIGAPKTSNGTSVWVGKTYLLLGSTARGMSQVASYPLSVAEYQFLGEFAGDRSGSAVASAGDVDDDGLGDLLIGAPENSDEGNSAGKTYLVLGNQLGGHGGAGSPIAINPFGHSLSSARAAFSGTTFTRSGSSVAGVDVDGDGLDDVLIGAPDSMVGTGQFYAGKTYLLLSNL